MTERATGSRGAGFRLFLLAFCLAAGSRMGFAQTVKATLIRNATVLPVSGPTLEGGSVLIENGKIAAVGKNVAAPQGAEVVDGAGMYLMPGIIDCHSHIAVSGGVNESTLP